MQCSLALRSLIVRPLQSSSNEFEHIIMVQLANLTNCPGLRTAEAILRSIIWGLTPHRKYKATTLTLAQRAVNVTAQIATLIEGTKEAPQWPEYIAHLEEVLHEIRLFLQTETQHSFLRRVLLWGRISNRYAAIEQRLTSVLNDAEKYNTELQAGNSTHGGVSTNPEPICSAQSQAPSFSLSNNTDVVRSGEILSNAHDVIITGGNYYTGHICIQHASREESVQGIVSGLRVVAFEDILDIQEIHGTPMYRLYSYNGSGRARVVKVYHGPRAKERAQETARFHKRVMHPTFLHIVGVSPLSSEVPFLVFNGGFEGSLVVSITKSLEIGKDPWDSIILGLQTVIGFSSSLDYLRDVAYPFINAGPQHFCAFLNLAGKVIISFDPDIPYDQSDLNIDERLSLEKLLFIFHELCQQTFDAACKAHYELQQVERAYNDTLETEDFNSFFGYDGLQGIGSTTVTSSTNVPLTKPSNGHRRELVWKSQDKENSSLKDICSEFKAFLDSLSPLSEPTLHRRRGRYTVRTAHRCPGYNRTEITLTPSITRSAIVCHSTPLPHEICPVCNRVVQDVEIFDCICGGEDDELPTIQCSKCCKWHHQRCVDSLESTTRSFTCPNCHRTQSKGESSKHVIGHPDRSLYLVQQAAALSPFSELRQTELEEAILMHRELLSLHPAPHPDRPIWLSGLGLGLWHLFQRTNSMVDLEGAISLHRESLSLRPAPHPNRSSSLTSLASALHAHFRITGSMTDLEEAISMHRESLSLYPILHPDRFNSLNNVANALQDRFRMTGSITDLEEAILIHRELLLSLDPTTRPMSLHNLGIALQDRFSNIRSMTDLDEAILILRESLSLRPVAHPGRLRALKTLASALETRFKDNGVQSDLDEASSLRREALAMS